MNSFLKFHLTFFLGLSLVLVAAPAAAAPPAEVNFNVDKKYDVDERSTISAVLIKTTPEFYFYVEKDFWRSVSQSAKSQVLLSLDALSEEFKTNIRPTLASTFGDEWNPGVDKDERITIMFHSMREGVGGYFREADEYVKLQVPVSNEREMLYFSANRMASQQLKGLLAHEFIHLISFNQKNRLRGVREEIWLDEARADFAPTLLGYNDVYEGSNLQRRVKDFLEKPDDSLVEWQDSKYDYAAVSLFTNYLVDQYGKEILALSLKSKATGIASINEALLKLGAKENFAQLFNNWTIALVVNDCLVNFNYCYSNEHLSDLRVSPTLNFLPAAKNSSLSVTALTNEWAGSWQKVTGGKGSLRLQFSGSQDAVFQVLYVLLDKNGTYEVRLLPLASNQEGEITIENFNSKYQYLILIPTLQAKLKGFSGAEAGHSYTFSLSLVDEQEEAAAIQRLLAKIEQLKRQIAALGGSPILDQSCRISHNLFIGVPYADEVKCLQAFLKAQGPVIYPEGRVTGTFGPLTKAAVVRFQEKYRSEILAPSGLARGTGYVGVATREKINGLLFK